MVDREERGQAGWYLQKGGLESSYLRGRILGRSFNYFRLALLVKGAWAKSLPENTK